MVGGVDDDAVFQQSLALEFVEDLTDLFVDHGEAGVVVLAHAADALGGGVAGFDDGEAVALFVASLFGEELVGDAGGLLLRDVGHGDDIVVVLVDEALRRVVQIVGAEEADVEVKRVFPFPAVEPVEGAVADEDVGVELFGEGPDDGAQVVVEVGVFFVEIQGRLVSGISDRPAPFVRLAFVHDGGLVALFGDLFVKAAVGEVGLADADAVVAAFPQSVGPVEGAGGAVEAEDAGVVRVEAGVEGGSAGDAGGGRAEGVFKDDAAGGEAVDIRGDDPVGAGAVHGVAALLLGGDENDVGTGHGIFPISYCR